MTLFVNYFWHDACLGIHIRMWRGMHAMKSIVSCILSLAFLVWAMPGAATEEKAPRLKYRAQAAACTCATGLSEADIERGRQGLDRLGGLGAGRIPNGEAVSDSQRRRASDEERK